MDKFKFLSEVGRKVPRVSFSFVEPSMTKKEYQLDTNINVIIERYTKTGRLETPFDHAKGIYGDFSNADDFQTAQNKLARAWSNFNQLPVRIRERFGNDPAKLLDFVSKEANRDEAIKLGLCKAPDLSVVPTNILDNVGTTDSNIKPAVNGDGNE